MAEKIEINDVRTCDMLIQSLNLKHLRAMKEKIRTERKLKRCIQFAEKYERELNEIGLQLDLIAENLIHLPEGALRDEHVQRQKALELRQRTILARMPDYSPDQRTKLTTKFEEYNRWVNILAVQIEQMKKRKEELLAG